MPAPEIRAPDVRPRVALIAGPTASGKSALAMEWAAREDGVVINADASQVYRDLRILSARPGETDLAAVPHRLFGHRDGAVPCSAADWAEEARAAIAETLANGRLPILVGGTGLYIRTLIDGIAPVPEVDSAIRAAVRALPIAEARAALETEDAAAAARIGPRDAARIARALEVMRSSGRSILAWRADRHDGIGAAIRLDARVIDPPADWLAPRIDRRVEAMIDSGAIEEVRALVDRGLDPALPVMTAIGVAPLAAFIAGTIDLPAAKAAITLATRRYAKRQRTWGRHQYPADWPRVLPG